MKVGELCSREVYVVERDEPLADAAREMRKRGVGALVVVESRGETLVPIGIVTDRDVVCGQLARKADLFCLAVHDVMSSDLLLLPEDCDLAEAIEALRRRGVRRAPVVGEDGALVGIVTLDDLFPAVAEGVSALAHLIGSQASVTAAVAAQLAR